MKIRVTVLEADQASSHIKLKALAADGKVVSDDVMDAAPGTEYELTGHALEIALGPKPKAKPKKGK